MAENRPEMLIGFAVVAKGSGDVTGLQAGIHRPYKAPFSGVFLQRIKIAICGNPDFSPLFCRSVFSSVTFYQRLSRLLDFHEIPYGRLLQNLNSKSKLHENRLNFSRTFRKMVNYSRGLLYICSGRIWMKFGTEYLHVMASIRLKFHDNGCSAK
jgi:hypothetical protein